MKYAKLKNIKIIATVGPASLQEDTIRSMESAGVDIFRINLSHTKLTDLESIVTRLKKWTKKTICLDTEGAQIRTGTMRGGQVLIKNNETIILTGGRELGGPDQLPLYPLEPAKFLHPGDVLHIDFNRVIIQVVKVEGLKVTAKVLAGGMVGSNKGVHLDEKNSLPAFTKKDLAAFKLAKKLKINCFSFSFAASHEDVIKIRQLFNYPVIVISKIESKSGLSNLSEICLASDGILIDRGDLSREVPLEKIGLAQTYIIKLAQEKKTPVYVATNLLESMIENFRPTRAEVNDITNTLLAGGQGLVLAAETAIGKHPVECTRMVADIIESVSKYKQANNYRSLGSMYEYNLIEPHGGKLVQNFLDPRDIKNFRSLPKLKISEKSLLDVIQIAEGVYSPLIGFMNYAELTSVLNNYRLPQGPVWTMPILLQVDKKDINFKVGQTLALQAAADGSVYAVLEVTEIKKIPKTPIARKWFGTISDDHPGVKIFKQAGDYLVAGPVYLVRKPRFYSELYNLSPKQTREIFTNLGWKKIVGFHTRNVIHRGHEYIQQQALRQIGADALFISPVIGPKKEHDFTARAIIQSYELMIQRRRYQPYPAFIGAFTTYSRYSGPREAVFTALCRKNFGCSHFIIGRDHTGVGNYYTSDASQKIFKAVGDIGIRPIMFETAYFCKQCRQITTHCSHAPSDRVKISGTQVRASLLTNKKIPRYLMRPEIAERLVKLSKNPTERLFE